MHLNTITYNIKTGMNHNKNIYLVKDNNDDNDMEMRRSLKTVWALIGIYFGNDSNIW